MTALFHARIVFLIALLAFAAVYAWATFRRRRD
jgi:hypothetical protein